MSNPYRSRPRHAFWSSEVAERGPGVMPHIPYAPFITRGTRIGTAGSCFAQHIARRLATSGFLFHVEEKPPAFMPEQVARVFGYGLFSARYGNIYTTRQLLQLLQRAEKGWDPQEAPWKRGDRFVDPFRPTLTPRGYPTPEAVAEEDTLHLAAVRRLFRKIDVFVFTLGLTECWLTARTGAALPICPGTRAGGAFDADSYRFQNFSYPDIRSDLEAFIELARSVNPNLQFLFTVSPVPLVATMEDHSVLTATVYSKSVLRAVVGDLEREMPFVRYFPSYEIITGGFNRGRYYEDDLRSIHSDGVDHVMRLFFSALCVGENVAAETKVAAPQLGVAPAPRPRRKPPVEPVEERSSAPDLVDVACDEILLDADR